MPLEKNGVPASGRLSKLLPTSKANIKVYYVCVHTHMCALTYECTHTHTHAHMQFLCLLVKYILLLSGNQNYFWQSSLHQLSLNIL